MSHEWEDPEGSPIAADPAAAGSSSWAWEDEDGIADASGSDSESEMAPPDPLKDMDAAANCFLDELLELYLSSTISARSFCVLNFWAARAGIKNETVGLYSLKPGQSSRNFQGHLDIVLGFRDEMQKHYQLEVPCTVKGTAQGRGKLVLPVRPIHEVIEERILEHPGTFLQLEEAISSGELPPCYTQHPVVTSASADDRVLAYSIYMDALPYSLVDSALGIWLCNVVSGTRDLLALVRKSMLCSCGCRGRCTMDPIMRWLRWSAKVAASGRHPERRHDRILFSDAEPHRLAAAGTPLQFKTAILYCKGDWAEFCERFGYPSCASNLRPCFCCAAAPEDLYNPAGVSRTAPRWHTNTEADFEYACSQCEVEVQIRSAAEHGLILAALAYDRRKDGLRGRCLDQDVACECGVNLLRGDRLEPTDFLADVGAFDTISNFPATVRFWRPANNTLLIFRCGLWDSALGLNPMTAPALDVLHAVHLGPVHHWCMATLWMLIDAEIWGAHFGSNYERQLAAIHAINAQLQRFYSAWDEHNPGRPCTRIKRLHAKLLGVGGKRRLRTKAMES